ncbi:MAG: hypothetical protein K0R53_3079 [Burkholderiales bacterium]|nr:hypothetical protein [Burkholderiales bacterium]
MKTIRRSTLALSGAALLSVCALTSCATSSGDAPRTLVWQLEQPGSIGGFTPEVLGSPKSRTVDGRKAVCFDGVADGLLIATNPIAGWPQYTVEVLMRPDGDGPLEQRYLHIQDDQERRLLLETRVTPQKSWALDTFLHESPEHKLTQLDMNLLQPTDRWYWTSLVYDGKAMSQYVDGVKLLEGPVAVSPMIQGRISLGVRQNRVSWFKGCIAEVRFSSSAGVVRPR